MTGLLAGGCEVHDIGLALSPMAYFAQFDLDVEGVAMVTASHNDNGWTGIKMGLNRPLTFGPEEMSRLKEIVLAGGVETQSGGRYIFVPDIPARYAKAMTDRAPYVVDLDVGLETTEQLTVGIDAIGTTEEVLVRELSPLLRGMGPFAGAIVRGDGSLRLALDVHALAPRARALGRVPEGRVSETPSRPPPGSRPPPSSRPT